MLDEQEKIELLALARSTLEAYFREGRFETAEPAHAKLRDKGGAFVTLERLGDLRGCIGHLAADKPLSLTVQQMAVEAATGDPRFPAVTAAELPDLQIEISVLADFRKIADVSEIKVGTHGLIVGDGRRRGLLLPQVAEREGWDVPTFLSATCRKAGLPLDAWRKGGVVIETFTAQVFSENDAAP